MSDIINLTLSALINKIKKKELSSQEITNSYIERAEKSKDLNTYITTDFENAIEKAKKFDEKGNFDYKLPGVPIAVKDLLLQEGLQEACNQNFPFRQIFLLFQLHFQNR